tara:strand:- start:1122 stop:1304 length:183 start_codon:yes stop_codon:yes gene_type:complete
MVAFARIKARSIFSKLRFTALSKVHTESHNQDNVEKLTMKKERKSNYFFEAIKSGGIWLS